MAGRVCVVTGATRGIGLATARGLAGLGAEVVLVGRDQQLLDDAIAEINRTSGSERVASLRMDLASMRSIRQGASELTRRWPAIHVLVNNAGVNAKRRAVTVDGRELTLAVNHLAPFLLTSLIAPALVRGAPSRVVSVTSIFAHFGRLDLDDLELARRRYDATHAYNRSKLANVMFTLELAERLRNTGVTANCVSPGLVLTDLMREHWWMTAPALRSVWQRVLLTPEDAAQRVLYVATSPTLAGVTGKLFARSATPARIPRDAQAADARRRLWELSALLTSAPGLPARTHPR
jgi:NAD(P)-dependent dehydrogenase (short-subunit alcohol dehydrogenase family)